MADGLEPATVKLLLDTGEKLKSQQLVDYPNDPERKILLAGGSHTIIQTPRQPVKRNHAVETVADFVAAYAELIATPYKEAAADKTLVAKPSPIWFDVDRVKVFIDDRFRDESIELELPVSHQLDLLEAWNDPCDYDQPRLIRILRHDLANCISTNVLAAFRTLSWQSIKNTRAVLEQNKQSMDADIQQTISQAIPEQFHATIPLFDHPDFRDATAPLTVTVDLVFDKNAFKLQLLPGELAAAAAARLQIVRERLAAAIPDVVAIAGSP